METHRTRREKEREGRGNVEDKELLVVGIAMTRIIINETKEKGNRIERGEYIRRFKGKGKKNRREDAEKGTRRSCLCTKKGKRKGGEK